MIASQIQISVGRYVLRPLLQVRRDDLGTLLGRDPGVYICGCAEPAWFEHFGLEENVIQHTVRKKERMFAEMAPTSQWISATGPPPKHCPTITWKNGHILHLGSCHLHGRAAQVAQTLMIIEKLTQLRQQYSYVLFYNFYMPFFLAALFAKYCLGKRLYVEYEDDYTAVRHNRCKNYVERLLRRTVDGAICVHEHMTQYFPCKPVRVCNGFADLSYMANKPIELREGSIFLYGGTLDGVRGADLVPDLVRSLRLRLRNFKVIVTGTGPLAGKLERCGMPEVDYRGVLADVDYARTVAAADMCLVLQRPDHPFSVGSFPSKVEEYARHQKPIFILELP